MLAFGLLSLLSLGLPTVGEDDDDINAPDTGDGGGEMEPETGNGDLLDEIDGRPPMGDEFRDPLVVAEELRIAEEEAAAAAEAQRLAEEAAALEARQPVNLVTVTDADGEEVPDSEVMELLEDDAEDGDGTGETDGDDDTDTETDTDGEDTDGEGEGEGDEETLTRFRVTGPEGAHDIDIRYDSAAQFEIEATEETDTITAALNSDISGPVGTLEVSETEETDADGNVTTTLTLTETFESSTDITMSVSQDQIGVHMTQIDLTNPDDTLHFEFDDTLTGNLHLVTSEVTTGTGDASTTTISAFVIQTPDDITGITDAGLADLLADPEGAPDGVSILAEIYLGEEALFVNSAQSANAPGEVRIVDRLNDTPMITTNIEWASEGTMDGNTDPSDPGDPGNDPGNDPNGSDPDSGFGLMPVQFPGFQLPIF